MAVTSRYLGFTKGLQQCGEHVNVLCMEPAARENAPDDLSVRGMHQGVEYLYAGGVAFHSSRRIGRVLQRLVGFFSVMRELRRRAIAGRLDVVLFSRLPSWQMVLVLAFCRRHGVKAVHERSEHPLLEAQGRPLRRLECRFYLSVLVRRCHGLIVISRALADLFRPLLGCGTRLLIVPANVDLDRFEGVESGHSLSVRGRYVAWCGSVWGPKDGVPQLVEAFSRVADSHPDVNLVLMAPTDGSEGYRRVQEMVHDSGLGDRIVITGRVSQADMPRYLSGAAVLALARPASLQAEYGFPTKLAEYLAAGRPVVVTRVGDIPLYLTDGHDAYLAAPSDIGDFAEKLDRALKNRAEAELVGQRGRATAERVFSAAAQARNLAAFFRELH